GEVLDRQLEEQLLARLAFLELVADCGVIAGAVLDGMVEDRRIRCESRHRQLVDVALQGAGGQEVAGAVVEPGARAEVVGLLRGLHRCTCAWFWVGPDPGMPPSCLTTVLLQIRAFDVRSA